MATIINNSKDAYKTIRPHIKHFNREEVFFISLGGNNNVKSVKLAAVGDIDKTVIPTRYIYQQLCIDGATGVVLIHTHPSGNPKPSLADISETKKFITGLKALDINLVDHIIVAEDSIFSFADEKVSIFSKTNIYETG